MPEGYDTELEQRGGNLSLGQRQLISFARALVADAKILVLDEATASIDSYTEMLIQKALEKLLEGRTGLVIAHRLATIRGADRIIVLQNGEIIESGTHDQLMRQQRPLRPPLQHELRLVRRYSRGGNGDWPRRSGRRRRAPRSAQTVSQLSGRGKGQCAGAGGIALLTGGSG